MVTRIPARGPLDFALSCYRYHVWGEDLANRYRDGRFRRITEYAGRLWLYEAHSPASSSDAPAVEVRVLACSEPSGKVPGAQCPVPSPTGHRALGTGHRRPPAAPAGPASAAIHAEVAWLFSLDEELDAFYQFAQSHDPTLYALCRALRGYRVTRAATLFEALVTSITAQQINLPFAFKVRNRLIEAYGRTLSHEGEICYAFPQPEALAAASPEELRDMQFSTRKAAYIVGLAHTVADGRLDERQLRELPNEEVATRLARLPGIGRWTAEWALIRALGRPDVIPADDLGVQHAAGRFYGGGTRATAAEVRRLAERWHPWETWATYYLLAGLRLPPEV